MAGHVELRNHADSALPRVFDDPGYLLLRIVEPAGAFLLEQGEELALHAKSLIVREVPMKDVQLDGLHRVQILFNHIDGDEVASSSIISPRHGKRGWSSMVTAGTLKP